MWYRLSELAPKAEVQLATYLTEDEALVQKLYNMCDNMKKKKKNLYLSDM